MTAADPSPDFDPVRSARLASDVRDVQILKLQTPKLLGDPATVAVDGSASEFSRTGGIGVVYGTGRVVGAAFTVEPVLLSNGQERLTSHSIIPELHAARVGLRPFPTGARVKLVSDSRDVAALIAQVKTGTFEVDQWMMFPAAVAELKGHIERLDVTVRLDHSRAGKVGRHHLIVAAHRLALTMMHHGRCGAIVSSARVPLPDHRWITRFVQMPGHDRKRIRKAVAAHMAQQHAPERTEATT